MIIEREDGVILHRNNKLHERNWRTDDTYKFIFSLVGKSYYETKRSNLIINTDQFVIMNPFHEHKQLHVDKEKFLVEISPTTMKNALESLEFHLSFDVAFAFQPSRHPQLSRWAQLTQQYLSNADNEKEAKIFTDYGILQLCVLLIKYGIGSHNFNWPDNPLEKTKEPICQVLEALKEDYHYTWTLNEMAKVAGLSKFQLVHRFSELLGISPYGWLQTYRLVRSQRLLKNTGKTILDIALECGFSSVGIYHHLFKKLYGITPNAFRKKYFQGQ